MNVYLVGGAVRDRLLGLPIKERDWVVVGSTAAEMLAQGYQQVGKDFPVFLHPKTKEEYALARTERKTGHGYTGFETYFAPDVSLEQDLLRRDLTINAMAETEQGEIIDPFGGRVDLEKRILRHVSEAFIEDPLRVLRVARFAAQLQPFGFTLANETQELLLTIVRQGEIQHLVPERVFLELDKALGTAGPHLFIKVLRECGALAVLFPELDHLFGVPNPPIWHPEIDSGVHTMMALEQAARLTCDKKIRFATLFHDLGKGLTDHNTWPSHKGHGEKGVELCLAIAKRYPIPTTYLELTILVSRFHITCHKSRELSAEELLALLEGMDAFRRPERVEQLLLACKADVRGRTGHENSEYHQAEFLLQVLSVANQVDIKDLMAQGLGGRELGEALRSKRIEVIRDWVLGHLG